jgi:hypothetical protein
MTGLNVITLRLFLRLFLRGTVYSNYPLIHMNGRIYDPILGDFAGRSADKLTWTSMITLSVF